MGRYSFAPLLFQLPAQRGSVRNWHQYLVVINPSGEANKYVREQKRELLTQLNNNSLYSHPHFTILCCVLPIGFEKVFIAALRKACARIPATEIVCDGHRHFVSSSTIYVATITKQFFKTLESEIRKSLLRAHFSRSFGKFSGEPHLTIVKNLSRAELALQWEKYKNAPCHFSFLADGLTVLRRNVNGRGRCKGAEVIPLCAKADLPALSLVPTQQCLFN